MDERLPSGYRVSGFYAEGAAVINIYAAGDISCSEPRPYAQRIIVKLKAEGTHTVPKKIPIPAPVQSF
jgi:hypothetical protein